MPQHPTPRQHRPHPRSSTRTPAATSLARPIATQLVLRRLSVASPLELEVLAPIVALTTTGLGFVLYAIKRLWTFSTELKIHDTTMQAKLLEAQRELDRLQETDGTDLAIEAARDAVIEAWNMIDTTLTDDDPS